MTSHLHFTFGPVQGFVAQARRTRDLYAGSFLLSWLAYQAMDAVQSAGGTIILPDFAAIRNLIEVDRVKYGVVPNRFVASFDCKQLAEKAADLACKGLMDEWRKIAEKVWKRFVSLAEPWGNETGEIWQRQIDNFWEMAWGVGDEQDSALLDRRKNWRSPPMAVEGGDHCTLMGQYQELSGFIRSRELDKQNTFWEAVRTGVNLNLKDDERLCAIAMIKRFFPDPEVAGEVLGHDLDAATWPSTVSIATLPWLKTLREKGETNGSLYEKARAYTDLVKNEPGALVSGNGTLLIMQDYPSATGLFKKLSGNFLNRTALQNKKGTLLNVETSRKDYIQALRELEHASDDRAGNFYALLLMDGDSMGKLIRKNDVKTVTEALTHFSAQVPGIVYEHNGITVYAGGDDLFALLPLDTTLDCAIKVSTSYKKIFSDRKITKATISGAVIFTHYSIPLRQVIAQAHYFLDEVAKDQTGRDAIAIAVIKPGGETCRWAGKIEHFKSENQEGNCFQPLIDSFNEEDRVDSLSSKYLYNLRQRFAALEEDAGSFGKDDLTDLFTAELVHGKISKKPPEAEKQRARARAVIDKLVAVCYDDEAKQLDFDGVRLMRFLALGGKEGNDR
jgi:CRISPR-associated protein Cmr2